MPKVKLTADKIRRFQPPESGSTEVVDTEAPGLVCRITAGGARTMGVRGRIKGGPTFRVTLGDYSLRPLDGKDGWREKARAIMARARDGEDPRVAVVEDMMFSPARDAYLQNPPPVSRGPRKGQPWSASHKREATRYLTRHVGGLERLKLRQITDAHIASALSKMSSPSLKRAAYDAISAFFSWCKAQRYVNVSPVAGLKAPSASPSRDRELTRDELDQVLEATAEMGYPGGHLYRAILLTGKRKREVAAMRWSDLDLVTGKWTIPAAFTKTGSALAEPISRQMVELLRSCPQFGEYVFTTNGRTPVSGFSKFEKRMYKLAGNKGDDTWRVHDFRRSFVSTAAREFRTPLAVADRALNHAGGARGVAAVYQQYDLIDERAELAQQWADWLLKEMNADNVVEMQRA